LKNHIIHRPTRNCTKVTKGVLH